MLNNLSSYFPRRKGQYSSPLLENDENGIEMSIFLNEFDVNRQREDQYGFDKDKELFDCSEIDQIDITRGRKSRKKFINGVFNKNKTRLLLKRVDVNRLTFKRQKFMLWILIFCLLLLLIHAFIAFKLILSSTSPFSRGVEMRILVNESVSSMVNDLKAEPIMDIQLATPSATCPDEYENMLLGEWPGTSTGCFCSSTNSLFRGNCRSNGQFLAGCRNIPKIDPVNLSTWNNMKWCVKRAQINQDYLNQSQCETGYKNCSFGVCMKESLSCPITSVGDSFTFLREIGKPPLTRVGIFLQNASCLKEGISDNLSYMLLNKGASECDQHGLDGELNRYLGQQKMESVLKENKAPEEVYSLPFDVEILTKSEATFSQRRQIEINEKAECLNIDIESILSQFSEIWEYERLKLYLWIGLSIMALLIVNGWLHAKYKDPFSWIPKREGPLFIGMGFLVYMLAQFVVYLDLDVYFESERFSCFSNSSMMNQLDELNDLFRLPSYFYIWRMLFFYMFCIGIFWWIEFLGRL